mmetsp:Transcript_51561/g.95398  ORF Transcript_51561/g.95398 Transcript_51561/m.95398 type:complete len:632 (-) Transcript_51561:274-2169(-)
MAAAAPRIYLLLLSSLMAMAALCFLLVATRWLVAALLGGALSDAYHAIGGCCRWKGVRAQVNRLTKAQDELINKGLVERFRTISRFLAPLVAILFVFRAKELFEVAISGPIFGKDTVSPVGSLRAFSTDFLSLACILVAVRPTLITPKVINVLLVTWHSFMLLEVALSEDELADLLAEMLFLRLGVSLVHGNSYLALLSILVSGLNCIICLSIIEDESDAEALCRKECYHGCLIIPAAVAAVYQADRRIALACASECMREMDEKVPFKVLLSSLCDAVVQVDDSCTVLAPARKLCGLLSMSDGRAHLKGASLLDLMPAREQERFAHYLSSTHSRRLHSEEDVGPAMAFQVLFQDSQGQPVPAQVLDCCFVDATDQRMHLLGVTELANIRRQSVQTSSSITMGTSRFTGESLASSGSAGANWLTNRDWQVDFEGSAPYRIVFAGHGFLREHGPEVIGSCFADLLIEREAVLAWVSQHKKSVDESGEERLLEFGQVTLKNSLDMETTSVTRLRVLSCFFMRPTDAGYDGYKVSARFMRVNRGATLPGARDGVGSANSQGFRDSSGLKDSCPVFRGNSESKESLQTPKDASPSVFRSGTQPEFPSSTSLVRITRSDRSLHGGLQQPAPQSLLAL